MLFFCVILFVSGFFERMLSAHERPVSGFIFLTERIFAWIDVVCVRCDDGLESVLSREKLGVRFHVLL